MVKNTLAKKITSLIIILSMILSLNTFATASFPDVDGTEWFYDDLMYLANLNVISGTGDGSFSANALLTKDALIKTLVVSQGYNPGNASGYWAQNYIDKADELGWLAGTIEGNYTSAINRYETCLLIVNALGSGYDYPANLEDFSIYIADYDSIPSNYKDVVLKVYALGIITGYVDNTFGGTNTLRRSEMAAIISRFNNPNNRKSPLNPSDLSEIENFANEDNTVIDPQTVKYEDNRLQYLDFETDTWKPITSTGLQPNIGRLAEDAYIATANYIHENTDYHVITTYAYSNFFMYVDDGTGTIFYSLSVDDASNVVTIDLVDLYYEEVGQLSQTFAYLHLDILKVFAPDDYQDIYNFAREYYELNNDPVPVVTLQTFGDISVRTIALQGSFRVELTIN